MDLKTKYQLNTYSDLLKEVKSVKEDVTDRLLTFNDLDNILVVYNDELKALDDGKLITAIDDTVSLLEKQLTAVETLVKRKISQLSE